MRSWMSRSTKTGLAACAALTVSLPAFAGMPASMDRVPTDALVAFSIENMAAFAGSVERLGSMLPDGLDMDMLEDLMGTDGLRADGSISMVVMPSPDGGPIDLEGDEGPLVVIVPVTDAGAFVNGLGGTAGAGLREIEIDGSEAWAKDIGGGYVAMSPMMDVLQGFEGAGGNAAVIQSALGETGMAVAGASDAVLVANIPALKPQLEEALAQFKQQAGMMAMMMGGAQAGQMQQQMELLSVIGDGFLRDARVGLVGIDLGDEAVHLDIAANFAEGSEIAGFFSAPGEAGDVLGHVPNLPFLFAGSFDISNPGIKKLMHNFMDAMPAEAMGGMGNPMAMLDGLDGGSFVIGSTPAIMSGLFTNTAYFYKSDNPQQTLENYGKIVADSDGTAQNGMKISSEFNKDAAQVDGRSVSTFSFSMRPEQGAPGAMQMQQMTMMMFGPSGGPSGYLAAVDGGVVQTMSQNSPLMAQLMKSGAEGGGLSNEAGVKMVSARMPEGRTFEVYIGVGNIMQAINGFMAMMGGGAQVDIPADLAPVGIGGTTNDGGFRTQVVIPTKVIETVASFAEDMGGGPAAAPQPRGGRPRF